MQLKRTNSNNPDFKKLILLLDQDLYNINGDIQTAYDQHNLIDFIETVIIAYIDDKPVGCGCFKKFDADTIEIKRMFVAHDHRGKGIATTVLNALELWAKETGYVNAVLETGKKHLDALHIYQREGYLITEKYEPYVDLEESVCMRKVL